MGKRYTKEEIDQIQALTDEGLTSNEIALQLGRPEAGIRSGCKEQGMAGEGWQAFYGVGQGKTAGKY